MIVVSEMDAATVTVIRVLARYTAAVDRRDAHAVAAAIGGARLHFKSHPAVDPAEVESFYDTAFATAEPATLHTPLLPVVEYTETGIRFEAPYVRYALDSVSPSVSACGRYAGRFEGENGTLALVEFSVADLKT